MIIIIMFNDSNDSDSNFNSHSNNHSSSNNHSYSDTNHSNMHSKHTANFQTKNL